MSETSKDLESTQAAATQRRNRLQLLGIMMIGFLTLGGSYLMFYLAQDSDGWGTTNNGTFVQPVITTTELGWQVEGNTRRWWLWVVSPDCTARLPTISSAYAGPAYPLEPANGSGTAWLHNHGSYGTNPPTVDVAVSRTGNDRYCRCIPSDRGRLHCRS